MVRLLPVLGRTGLRLLGRLCVRRVPRVRHVLSVPSSRGIRPRVLIDPTRPARSFASSPGLQRRALAARVRAPSRQGEIPTTRVGIATRAGDVLWQRRLNRGQPRRAGPSVWLARGGHTGRTTDSWRPRLSYSQLHGSSDLTSGPQGKCGLGQTRHSPALGLRGPPPHIRLKLPLSWYPLYSTSRLAVVDNSVARYFMWASRSMPAHR